MLSPREKLSSAGRVVVLIVLAFALPACQQSTDKPPPSPGGAPGRAGDRGNEAPPILTKSDYRASIDKLKQIGRAMLQFLSDLGYYPPADVLTPAGKPILSWRVLILPHLGHEDLFRQFNRKEPWDSPHNKKLLDKMPDVYRPVAGKVKDSFSTYYRVFTGPGTAFEYKPGQPKPGQTVATFLDGVSNTILVVEAGEAVPWTKPEELPYDPKKPLPKLGGLFPDRIHVLLGDASVIAIHRNADERLIREIILRNDGKWPIHELLGSGRSR